MKESNQQATKKEIKKEGMKESSKHTQARKKEIKKEGRNESRKQGRRK